MPGRNWPQSKLEKEHTYLGCKKCAHVIQTHRLLDAPAVTVLSLQTVKKGCRGEILPALLPPHDVGRLAALSNCM